MKSKLCATISGLLTFCHSLEASCPTCNMSQAAL